MGPGLPAARTPRDSTGSILDHDTLPQQIASLLRLTIRLKFPASGRPGPAGDRCAITGQWVWGKALDRFAGRARSSCTSTPPVLPSSDTHAVLGPANHDDLVRLRRARDRMNRRIEQAKALLRRGDLSVTEVCMAVGCTSLGSFSSRFTELVGETPSAYRARSHEAGAVIPSCEARTFTRPNRAGPPPRP